MMAAIYCEDILFNLKLNVKTRCQIDLHSSFLKHVIGHALHSLPVLVELLVADNNFVAAAVIVKQSYTCVFTKTSKMSCVYIAAHCSCRWR